MESYHSNLAGLGKNILSGEGGNGGILPKVVKSLYIRYAGAFAQALMVKCFDGRNCVKNGGWTCAPLWDHIERPVLGNEARHQT